MLVSMHRFLTVALLFAATSICRAVPVTYSEARTYLVQWEGYKTTPYRDGPAGHYSVGIGHSLTANGEVPRARYSPTQIERYFAADLSWALDACRAGVRRFDDLPKDIQLVALSVAFTTGRTGFHRFTNFRRALSWRAYDAAAVELADSKWRTQVSVSRFNHCVRVLRRKGP